MKKPQKMGKMVEVCVFREYKKYMRKWAVLHKMAVMAFHKMQGETKRECVHSPSY